MVSLVNVSDSALMVSSFLLAASVVLFYVTGSHWPGLNGPGRLRGVLAVGLTLLTGFGCLLLAVRLVV